MKVMVLLGVFCFWVAILIGTITIIVMLLNRLREIANAQKSAADSQAKIVQILLRMEQESKSN